MPRKSAKSTLTREDLKEAIEPMFGKIQEIESEGRRTGSLVAHLKETVAPLVDKINKTEADVKDISNVIETIFGKIQQIETEGRRSGVLLEQMDKKIDLALDVSKMVTGHEIVTRDHERRLRDVESNVQILHRHLSSKDSV